MADVALAVMIMIVVAVSMALSGCSGSGGRVYLGWEPHNEVHATQILRPVK